MLIKNPDALKSWLVVVLEPLCDADSSALARYVLALVKKDKPDKDLKRMMVDQLDVFLNEATTKFVERLFKAIDSEEYFHLPSNTQLIINDDDATVAVCNESNTSLLAEKAVVPAQTAMKEYVIKSEVIQDNNSNKQLNINASNNTTLTQQQSSSSSLSASTNASVRLGDIQTTIETAAAPRLRTTTPEQKTKDPVSNTTERLPLPTTATSIQHSVHTRAIAPNAGNHLKSYPQSSHHHHNNQQQHHHQHRSASPPARANADKENQPRDTRRRASLRSRSRSPRSRSRSNERVLRRSRSRERRAKEREQNQRQLRNKSPSTTETRHHASSGGSRRNFERRRVGGTAGGSASGGNGNANHLNDERSARFVNAGGNSNKNRNTRSTSRSRSKTPERQRVNHGHNSSERLALHQQIMQSKPHTQQSLQLQATPKVPKEQQRKRCRDFDEKGYCVRGETCPWDHGINPVVFEGINNSALISISLREYNPDAPDLWSRSGPVTAGPPPPAGSINPFSGNVRPNALLGTVPGGTTLLGPNGAGPGDYTNGRGPPMMPFPFNPTAVTTPLQRQLVPIPVVDGNNSTMGAAAVGGAEVGKRRYDLEDSVAIADGPPKRKVPINSRLGPRVDRTALQHNCSLELRKVPRGLNTIAHLNNHFAKFGKIVNIQVSYDGDPEAAIVTFSTHAEANVAYRSTEAVLNNRFIKVFWHSQDLNSNSDSNMNTVSSGNVGGRKNSQYHLHNVPAVPTPNADSAKTINTNLPAANNAAAAPDNATNNSTAATAAGVATTAVNNTNANEAANAISTSMRLKHNVTARPTAAIIRKKQEEQAKAVVQLANGLRKRKQELLQSYVKQMKSALEIIERCEPNDPQRVKTLDTIKTLQESIDKLHKEIAAEQEQLQAQITQQQQHGQQPPIKKTKEQQKKEILDIELELFSQQQEGNDTTAIQKRLEDLQRSLGIGNSSITLPGNNAIVMVNAKTAHYLTTTGAAARNPKIRATYPEGSTRVDRRPKAIVVTGFAAEDADFVLGHFKHFGEITKHDVDREIPQLILSYATRINAEQAVLRGKIFKDKRLQITWAPVVQLKQSTDLDKMQSQLELEELTTTTKHIDKSLNDADSILVGGDLLPELRLEDEEEDDETEDRSWRR